MVTFDARDLVNVNGDVLEAAAGAKEVDSEEEFREFVKNNQPPEGYVWGRTPFGTAPECWKIYAQKEPEIRGTGTDIEQQLERYLDQWATEIGSSTTTTTSGTNSTLPTRTMKSHWNPVPRIGTHPISVRVRPAPLSTTTRRTSIHRRQRKTSRNTKR